MSSPKSPFLTYIRGRFVRDPLISDRKDNSGNKVVVGTVRVIEKYVDRNGDDRQSEKFVDFRVFEASAADEIARKNLKKDDAIEAWGRFSYEEDDYIDKATGEEKKAKNYRLTVSDDNPEHRVVIA